MLTFHANQTYIAAKWLPRKRACPRAELAPFMRVLLMVESEDQRDLIEYRCASGLFDEMV